MKFDYILFPAILLLGFGKLHAQTLPVGSVAEDLYRTKQLTGEVAKSSFSIRPLTTDPTEPDSISRKNSLSPGITPYRFAKSSGIIKLLPVSLDLHFNSDHPYGWNDGVMIPSKGLQTVVSAGIFAKLGIFSVQIQPEFLTAQNLPFNGFDFEKSDADLSKYYQFYSNIDAPEQFGTQSYNKVSWGQSSVRLTYGPASIGFSTENLWWGPGIQNSLLLTNNAPGFKHFTLNTTRPVHTPIGAFEGQIIGGWLEESGHSPLVKRTTAFGSNLYIARRNEKRYLSGLNINYQPKWIPGLSLGFIRTFMAYQSDLKKVGDYVPFFVKLQKETGDQDDFDRDQRISLYARWLFQKANAELYFEYGINDNAYNFRDFLGSPDHGRAYIFGLNKLVPLANRDDQFLQINAEINQLSQTIDRTVRPAGSFYQHFGVNQGYTHYGQVLGAGSGTGGNLQTLQINWINKIRKIGFSIQRFEHNMDFYDMYLGDINQLSRKWVDFAVGVNGQWDYKNLVFRTKLQGIQSLNYQWLLKDYVPGDVNYIPHNDVFNFHGEVGVTYRF